MFKFNKRYTYVGTSLSKCVISILNGEMNYDNVIGMITNTRIKDEGALCDVVEGYLEGDMWGYGYWTGFEDREDEIWEIVHNMWNNLPFYQPRLEHGFVIVGEGNNFFRDAVWLRAEKDLNSPWYKNPLMRVGRIASNREYLSESDLKNLLTEEEE